MPVLHAQGKRILYIHVPKTGGTFVEHLLARYGTVTGIRHGTDFGALPCSPQHFDAALLEHTYSAHAEDVVNPFDYVFMTVREPLERMRSAYAHQHAYGNRVTRIRNRLGVPVPFPQWLDRSLRTFRRNPYTLDNHGRPQHQFRAFEPAVFRLEDGFDHLARTLDAVTGLQGTMPPAPLQSHPRHPSVDDTLPPRTLALFRDVAREDYATFGYDMP